jgi:3-deoxy-D-manno-octulosonic-acid transferase
VAAHERVDSPSEMRLSAGRGTRSRRSQGNRAAMKLIYSALLTLAALLSSPYWICLAIRRKKYLGNIRQRLGLVLPRQLPLAAAPLWIHSVSVGEVLAARPLVLSLCENLPDVPVVVSTVTLTGQKLAQNELSKASAIFFFPFDWAFSVRKYLARINPRAVVLMETELWPNFLTICAEHGIPVFLANGRISDMSFGRYRRIRWLTRRMLEKLKIIGVQTGEDRRRFLELGAEEARIRVTGNLKFDFKARPVEHHGTLVRQIRTRLRLDSGGQAIVVGSSMRGEESFFLETFLKVRADLNNARMILAPRHPERFAEVAELAAKAGISFCRRTELGESPDAVEMILLDTIGELRAIYELADVAVIGGSFLPFGGHNLLEPAALGKAIVFGPEMGNFREMARLFLSEHAALQCTPKDLAVTLIGLLRDLPGRIALGDRAAATLHRNQGATQSTVEFLLPHIR